MPNQTLIRYSEGFNFIRYSQVCSGEVIPKVEMCGWKLLMIYSHGCLWWKFPEMCRMLQSCWQKCEKKNWVKIFIPKTLFVSYLNCLDFPKMFCNGLLWSSKGLNQVGVENSAHKSPLPRTQVSMAFLLHIYYIRQVCITIVNDINLGVKYIYWWIIHWHSLLCPY